MECLRDALNGHKIFKVQLFEYQGESLIRDMIGKSTLACMAHASSHQVNSLFVHLSMKQNENQSAASVLEVGSIDQRRCLLLAPVAVLNSLSLQALVKL
jgi:hypothetical protein